MKTFVILALLLTPAVAAADSFVLVGNSRGAPHTLSHADVRGLYTGKVKTFGGNAAVMVVRPDDDATFNQFTDKVFGLSAHTLLAKIKQEVFKGEMIKPIKSASDDDVLAAVAGSAGTLGIVSSQAAAHLPKTVVVVAIGD